MLIQNFIDYERQRIISPIQHIRKFSKPHTALVNRIWDEFHLIGPFPVIQSCISNGCPDHLEEALEATMLQANRKLIL